MTFQRYVTLCLTIAPVSLCHIFTTPLPSEALRNLWMTPCHPRHSKFLGNFFYNIRQPLGSTLELYTVSTKGATLFLIITLSIRNRFLPFLCHVTHEWRFYRAEAKVFDLLSIPCQRFWTKWTEDSKATDFNLQIELLMLNSKVPKSFFNTIVKLQFMFGTT